jgi:hypothetical protein
MGIDHRPHLAWGPVVIGWGLGGAARALPPWPLAVGVVLRHLKEDRTNLRSEARGVSNCSRLTKDCKGGVEGLVLHARLLIQWAN